MKIQFLNSRGDTIVEVLLSTVILSIVLAGAYNLTTSATRINQQAYERTRVSNFMQEQAEILRSARDRTDPAWIEIIDTRRTGNTPTIDCKTITNLADLPSLHPNGFYLIDDPDPTIPGFTFADSPPIPLLEDLFYVWVEAYDPKLDPIAPQPDATYIDLYVNACWVGIGQTEKQQSGLVLRLERTTYN